MANLIFNCKTFNLSLFWALLIIFLNPVSLQASSFETVSLPAESHPFVYFRSDEINQIKSKIERDPYKSWYASLVARTDKFANSFDPEADDVTKMLKAKELAFRYQIDKDPIIAEKAVKYLQEFQYQPVFTQLNNSPIRYARVLFDACAAYDMLYIYLIQYPDLNIQIRKRLAAGAQASHDFMPVWYTKLKNNWGIRQYSALALAALTLADGVDGFNIEDWWRKSEKQLSDHFKFQITPIDGAWCEGYSYIAYSGDLYLPYFHAKFRATGDNLFQDKLISKTHRWAVDVLLPDGFGPMFDDSTNSRFQFEQLTRLSDNPEVYHWAYLQSGGTAAGINLVDAICNYDDSPTPKAPAEPPSRYLYDAGNMVFRSGWDSHAIYALFLGEHGAARINGGGHEHPDVSSFQIFAYGNWYLLDSGYGGWDHRARTNKPEDHNLILVDGKGPSELKVFGQTILTISDGEIFAYDKKDRFERCTIRTSYQGCNINRHVFFVDNDTFIIFDAVISDFERHYTWRYHLNAGFQTGAEYIETNDGAVINRDNNLMYLNLFSISQPITFKTMTGEHAFKNSVFNNHAVREAHVTGNDAQMLTILHFSQKECVISSSVDKNYGKIVITVGDRIYELDISQEFPELMLPSIYPYKY